MRDESKEEHPLDVLLDAESDESFGVPIIRDRLHHGARESMSGDLQSWTAEDFSSIYVRFHPHLLRHASRYVSNPALAEEVVQDAFLYLLTSLPELDSELGVLKFLKWKIRLLSYDVLRSSTNRQINVSDEMLEVESGSDISHDIERAEDAAVIKLALAKLNPRQREVLIASVYEEKSYDEISAQVGLSNNATRQLIHRARRAFKVALIGEAESKGMSFSEIMSVAARRAATEAKKNVTVASVSVIVISISALIFSDLPAANDEQITIAAPVPSAVLSERLYSGPAVVDGLTSEQEYTETETVEAMSDTRAQSSTNNEIEAANSSDKANSELGLAQVEEDPLPISIDSENQPIRTFSTQEFSNVLSTDVNDAGIYSSSYSALFSEIFEGESIEVFGGTGISAFLDLDTEELEVREVLYQFNVDGNPYVAVASNQKIEKFEEEGSTILLTEASGFYIVGNELDVITESPLYWATAITRLELSAEGFPESASIKITG